MAGRFLYLQQRHEMKPANERALYEGPSFFWKGEGAWEPETFQQEEKEREDNR